MDYIITDQALECQNLFWATLSLGLRRGREIMQDLALNPFQT